MKYYQVLSEDIEAYYNSDKDLKCYKFADEFFIYDSIRNQQENIKIIYSLCIDFLSILKDLKIKYFLASLPSIMNFYYDINKDDIISEPILINGYSFEIDNFKQSIIKILDENKNKLDNGIAIYKLDFAAKKIKFYLSETPLLTFDRYKELHIKIINNLSL